MSHALLSSPNALVPVTIYNPSWDFEKWAEYSNLDRIELLYRAVGDAEWSYALDGSENRIAFPYIVAAVSTAVIFSLIN